MTLDSATITVLANRLEEAERKRAPITKITDEFPDLDFEDAYAIQNAIRDSKINAGLRVAGLKAGLTSQAKMKQMNVDEPVFGFLCDTGAFPDGAEMSILVTPSRIQMPETWHKPRRSRWPRRNFLSGQSLDPPGLREQHLVATFQ